MRSTVLAAVVFASLTAACEPPDVDLVPDERLQTELGLTPDDRVHTVSVSTGPAERAEPDSIAVEIGDYVQFVSVDWLVHEMAFDLDRVGEAARAFLERTGQSASPPLLERDSRFVLSFADAPPGPYPYTLAGNREGGGGVIVVLPAARR